MTTKSIIVISSGQPSLNPRLVKEADALTAAGYQVTVLYAYWNEWGTRYDEDLLAKKKWKAIRIGGDPQQSKLIYFISRVIFKVSKYFIKKEYHYGCYADFAAARSTYFLIKNAKNHKAGLYIAHNIGALPAAYKAAACYKKPFGFDAEDFHRHELTDDINSAHYRLTKYLEDKYLPMVNYVTASSPMIARQYAILYNKKVAPILNVFPKTQHIAIINNESGALRLFWFSQTVGPNRGLEIIIEAMGQKVNNYELHLLGEISPAYKQQLLSLGLKNGIEGKRINFHSPVKAEEIFNIAQQFDIGLASEPGFSLNNNIALSNKLFTYIQCGLAVAASATPAQRALMLKYPQAGKIYDSASELSIILNNYHLNRELLYQTKKEAFKIGQTELNWEAESTKFISIVKKTLDGLSSNEF